MFLFTLPPTGVMDACEGETQFGLVGGEGVIGEYDGKRALVRDTSREGETHGINSDGGRVQSLPIPEGGASST